MTGYILLFVGLLLSNQARYGKNKLIFMFLVIAIFSSLRYGIGYDYYQYLICCQKGAWQGDRFEFIPYYIVKLSQRTFPYLFFIITSFFISFFYYLGIKKEGKDYLGEILFYVCFPFLFYNQLSVVRQAMASAVVFYIITLKQNEKSTFWFNMFCLLMIVLAILCHKSAIIAFLLFFPWQKVSKMQLWIILASSFILGEFVIPIFESVINLILTNDYDREKALNYLSSEKIVEGRFIKYLLFSIALMSLFLYKKLTQINKNNAYYISILILGVSLFAIFSFNSILSTRFCMFFFSTSIILVPQIVKVIAMPKALYVFLCVLLFSIQIYIGSNNVRPYDDPGCSVSYPYRTFLSKSLD